ncbi:RNA-directed DNA polymerase, eukaryota, reverse transcriptase zinc-binding domain protein [Tanacetum coccineum]
METGIATNVSKCSTCLKMKEDYQKLSSLLANRLVVVLGSLVNEVQSAFVADRQILDGPFILNEIFQWCKSKKEQSLVFKVDFEKAYDSVQWDYLDDILRKFSFGDKWRVWIQNCLHSSRGSVIVIGSLTEEFHFYKGLKQGDPLSPFLFILVMESLHVSFQRVVDACMFNGISLDLSLHLSYMFYADDAIFLGQWNESNINTIVHVLDCFHRASGLRINMSKSKLLGISVDADKVDQAARKIGCVTLQTPFKYLGSKVGGIMSRIQSWNETVEGMANRLSRWKMKTLSIGVKAIHGGDGKIGKKAKSTFPSLWLDIVHEVEMLKDRGIDLISFIHKKLGNGADTLFWEDAWQGDPRGGVEKAQFDSMLEKVEGTLLADMRDRWTWSLEGSGDFFVASVRKLLDGNMLPEVASKTRWIKAMPIKVNVHAWRVKLDCLPTRINISRKGMKIESIICPMCGEAAESSRHVFFSCRIAREMLRKISRWWDVSYMELSSYEEWLDWILNIRISVKHKQILEGVCYATWWHIWNFRNKCIFDSESPSKAIILEDVVSRSFYWCRYRCKGSFS